jgi:hypothetical protein
LLQQLVLIDSLSYQKAFLEVSRQDLPTLQLLGHLTLIGSWETILESKLFCFKIAEIFSIGFKSGDWDRAADWFNVQTL